MFTLYEPLTREGAMDSRKIHVEAISMVIWSLVLIAVLAYIGQSVASAINADLEKLQSVLSGKIQK
jgi:hypothetical protein